MWVYSLYNRKMVFEYCEVQKKDIVCNKILEKDLKTTYNMYKQEEKNIEK